MNVRRSSAGFTLIELMVGLVLSLIAVSAAFAFAKTQMNTLAGQDEVARMQSSAQLVLEGLGRDIQNAGYGTSFYAGMPNGPAGLPAVAAVNDSTGRSRGFPALRIANNIVTPPVVMRDSDAVLFLRVTSRGATTLEPIACSQPSGTVVTIDPDSFPNLETCTRLGGLVLLSDASRPTGEPESMLVAIAPELAGANRIRIIDNAWGISPAAGTRCASQAVPPAGVGVSASVSCVEPVSYWVDSRARLRFWRPVNAAGMAGTILAGGRVPINPANDMVLAEGVETLQLAVMMSNEPSLPAGLRNAWLFDVPTDGALFSDEGMLSEARVIRINALVRTTRTFDAKQHGRNGLFVTAGRIEDADLGTRTPVVGCADYSTCYDPSHARMMLQFQSELRNMRIFDLLSNNSRGWSAVRSYR